MSKSDIENIRFPRTSYVPFSGVLRRSILLRNVCCRWGRQSSLDFHEQLGVPPSFVSSPTPTFHFYSLFCCKYGRQPFLRRLPWLFFFLPCERETWPVNSRLIFQHKTTQKQCCNTKWRQRGRGRKNQFSTRMKLHGKQKTGFSESSSFLDIEFAGFWIGGTGELIVTEEERMVRP